MKKIRNLILVLGIALGVGLFVPVPAHATASVISDQCAGVTDSSVCSKQNDDPNTLIGNIVNVLLYIVGAVSVVMIIVGGLMFVTSAGDSSRTTTARNTVMYAVVGLVVAIIAYAIVNYVKSKFA